MIVVRARPPARLALVAETAIRVPHGGKHDPHDAEDGFERGHQKHFLAHFFSRCVVSPSTTNFKREYAKQLQSRPKAKCVPNRE